MSETMQTHDVVAALQKQLRELRTRNTELEAENEYLKSRAAQVEADQFVLRCWLDEKMGAKNE